MDQNTRRVSLLVVIMDKNALDMRTELFSNIVVVVRKCIDNNYGRFVVNDDNIDIFTSYIAVEISKYDIRKKNS